jgi:hypothetical protein
VDLERLGAALAHLGNVKLSAGVVAHDATGESAIGHLSPLLVDGNCITLGVARACE